MLKMPGSIFKQVRFMKQSLFLKKCSKFCYVLFAVKKDETQYKLSDFLFENLEITARKSGTIQKGYIHGLQLRNVVVNGVRLK